MDLNDVSMDKVLTPTILLKVLASNENSIRQSLIEFLNSTFIAENINEDNLFDFLDNKINYKELDSFKSVDGEKKLDLIREINSFSKSVDLFLEKEGIKEINSKKYSTSFNKRVLSDLKPFCLNIDLIQKSVMKAKAPTISNTDYLKNLNVKLSFEPQNVFSRINFDAVEMIKSPINKVGDDGIEQSGISAIQHFAELNGFEFSAGKINISMDDACPVLISNEFEIFDEYGFSNDLLFVNSSSNKDNVLTSIQEKISGLYMTNCVFNKQDIGIDGKVIFVHDLDYMKTIEYQKNPLKMPSFDYKVTKNGEISLNFSEEFLESYKTYISGLDNNLNLKVGNPKSKLPFNLYDILLNAEDFFKDEFKRNSIMSLRNINNCGEMLLKNSNNLQKMFNDADIKELDKQAYEINKQAIDYLKNITLDSNNENLAKIQSSGIQQSLLNFNFYNKENSVSEEIKSEINLFLKNYLELNNNDLKKMNFLNLSTNFEAAINIIESKQQKSLERVFDFANKANEGSLKNDRTAERKILEFMSQLEKETGVTPDVMLSKYMDNQKNILNKNIELMNGYTSGLNENLDFRDRVKLPLISINEVPEKTIDSNRIAIYDLETSGLKAKTEGVSQFTCLVVDYDKSGKMLNRFIVDEYTNPESNPLPVIGKDKNGYIFGEIVLDKDIIDMRNRENKSNVIFGFSDSGLVLDNDNYHSWKTMNPEAKMFDSNENEIKHLYPQQNIGAILTHGIENNFLVEKPSIRDINVGIKNLFDSADKISGFNTVKFDNNFLLGVFNKNQIEFSIDSNKNLDLKQHSGDLFTYSQVRTLARSAYKNSSKLELDNNEMYSGKKLNTICQATNTSLAQRYVSGKEVHDAKADVVITGNLLTNTYNLSKQLIKNINNIEKEFNLKDDKIKDGISEFELTEYSSHKNVLNSFKKLERVFSESINQMTYDKNLRNINEISPDLLKEFEVFKIDLLTDKLDIKDVVINNKKIEVGLEI